MPAAEWTDLLTAEGADLSQPEQVERALAHLWQSTLQAHRGDGAAPIASRVCVANLIIVAHESQWNVLSVVLGELSPIYPTRTLVLLLTQPPPDPAVARDSSGVRASVTALCHVPQPGESQVCCEQVVLRTGITNAEQIVHTLLPLLESDVPIMVWWTCDPAEAAEVFVGLQSFADRVVIDAGPRGFFHLAPQGRCPVRDLGWYRTVHWRELVAGLWDGCAPAVAGGVGQLSIVFAGGDAVRADALWLLAFVAGQLGWQPARRAGADAWSFTGAEAAIEVTILEREGPERDLLGFTMTAGRNGWVIQHCSHRPEEYRVIVHQHDVCELPRTVQLRTPDRAASLVAAFTGRSVDRAFLRAAPVARWLVEPASLGSRP